MLQHLISFIYQIRAIFLCFSVFQHFESAARIAHWPNFNACVFCHQVARLIAAKKRENAEAASQNTDDLTMDDDDTMDQTECGADILVGGTGGSTSSKPSKKVEDDNEGVDLDDLGLLGLDQAILGSIDKCGKWPVYLGQAVAQAYEPTHWVAVVQIHIEFINSMLEL